MLQLCLGVATLLLITMHISLLCDVFLELWFWFLV